MGVIRLHSRSTTTIASKLRMELQCNPNVIGQSPGLDLDTWLI